MEWARNHPSIAHHCYIIILTWMLIIPKRKKYMPILYTLTVSSLVITCLDFLLILIPNHYLQSECLSIDRDLSRKVRYSTALLLLLLLLLCCCWFANNIRIHEGVCYINMWWHCLFFVFSPYLHQGCVCDLKIKDDMYFCHTSAKSLVVMIVEELPRLQKQFQYCCSSQITAQESYYQTTHKTPHVPWWWCELIRRRMITQYQIWIQIFQCICFQH